MTNRDIEVRACEKVSGIEAKLYKKFEPGYTISSDDFNSMRCQCACAPTPRPYCGPSVNY